MRWRGDRPQGRGDRLWRSVHEYSRIDTNSNQIREIRVNSWTVNWCCARALFAAVASGAPCALWGEDDTRRVLPRARIDPEYANPLYTPAMAALWRGE